MNESSRAHPAGATGRRPVRRLSLHLYLERNSVLHRLHPVVRLLGMAAFFVTAFLSERPALLLPLAAVVGLLLWTSGSLVNVVRLRIPFVMVFSFTFLIWTIFYGPDGAPPLLQIGRWLVSRTAPLYALGMAMKLTLFLAAGTLFLSTTRIEEFAYALHRCGVPYKLGFTLTLSFRLVPVFIDTAAAVVQAQRCRGLDFERGSLWQRLRRYVPVIIPVVMNALRRADNMAMALEARGFQSGKRRTTLVRYRFGAADVLALALLLALTVAYIALWWSGVVSLRV